MRKTESTTRVWAAQLARVVLVVLLAGAANAATFSVASQGSNLSWQTGETVLPILGNTPTYGGIPTFKWRPEGNLHYWDYPTIMGTGSNPVSLTIGPGLIDKTLPYPVRIPTTYPGIPQFTTQLNMYAPKAGSTAMFGPGLAPGPSAGFSWCPNGTMGAEANPSCATVLPGGTSPTQGTISGIVKYTPGLDGPRFGGTMAMFTSGRFSWFEVVPPITPTYKLKLNNPPGTTPPNPSAAAGAGYSNYVYNSAGPGDPLYTFASPAAVPKVTTTYGGMVITNPLITTPSGDNKTLIPGGTSMSWGFPFTTGTVYIKVPTSNPGPFLTVTGKGYDHRTPQGTGNIQMVAGGMIHGDGPGGTITLPQIFTITLNVPEPSRVLMLGSGVALLGLVAVARRRTSARADQARAE